jgi:type I restriction enzyme, S subunit
VTLRVHPDEIVAKRSSGMLATHSSWERVRLDQIASVLNGCAFPSTGFGKSGDMPLIRIRDVGRESTDTWYTGAFEPQYVIENGSLIVAMDGEFRVDVWRGTPSLLNQRVCKIAVRDPTLYSERFLRWVLPGYLEAVNHETSSVTVKHLSSQTIKELPLPLPPIAEQERIVVAIEEQFSRLDTAIEISSRVERHLRRLRMSLIFAALDGSLVSVDHTRWARRRLSEVVDIASGQTPKGLRVTESGPVPYFKVGDMNTEDSKFMSASRTYVTDGDARSARLHIRPAGTVVFPKRGGAIATNKKRILAVDAAYDLNTMGLVPGPEIESTFLYTWITSIDLNTLADGSNVPQINHGDLADLVIALPPKNVQTQILDRLNLALTHADSLEATVRQAIGHSARLRSSVLSTAFSGNLVPQKLRDEPASVLLERIAAERTSSSRRKPTEARSQRRTKVIA